MTGSKGSPIMLMGRDIALLRHLHSAKLLDREQIQQLLDFGSVTRANDRLSRLHAVGLLHRYFVGTVAGGRKALYTLSARGASTVDLEKPWRLQRAEDELLVGEAFVEHQLAINWCWIRMQANLNRHLRFSEPICPAIALQPDGYAELTVAGNVQPIFLEIDLGTETSRVWDRKVELYIKLASSGEFERILQQPRFKVAVVCTSDRRLQSLRKVIRKHTPKLFYFALLSTIKSDGFCSTHWLRPEGDTQEPIA